MSYSGYYRGRGGPRGPRPAGIRQPGGYGPPPLPPDMIYKSFDPLESKHLFQRVAPEKDDTDLSQAIIAKNQELTPPPEELAKLQEQVTKMTSIVDTLVVSPVPEVDIEEMRVVGSFKKGTILAGHKTADIVLIIKHLPTLEDITNIQNLMKEKMNAQQPEKERKKATTKSHESGFSYTFNGSTLNVFVTTLPNNTKETIDPEKHLKLENLKNSLAAIRHARWFEENAYQSSIRILVRILKDFKKRIPFFKNVNPWTIDLLAHHAAVANTNGNTLSVPQVFRRCLQLLAAGILLPGSASISDPCEPGFVKAHSFMSYEHQDELACGAQTLLRALSHGGYKEILAMKGARKITFESAVMFDGIIVTPSKLAYEKPAEPAEPMETNGS
ncbi:hypothetical protein ACHWQZ_G011285 [Mnemiopsis leidyi]